MRHRRLAILVAAGSITPITRAQPCVDGWQPGFHVSDLPSSYIQSFAVYDDGSGPALYVGGLFSVAGDVATDNIVKWTGSSWVRVAQDMQVAPGIDPRNGGVRAMRVFDPDGPGPQPQVLIAAGEFANVDGVAASRIASWDGEQWQPIGSGLPSSCAALAEFQGRLIATGGGSGNGLPPPYLKQWNGSTWEDVGGGIAGAWASALLVHDDGHGPSLYVAGYLQQAGSLPVGSIARWDGAAWHDLATPLYPNAPDIRALASFRGDLYAGGSVGAINPSSRGLCRWNGSAWFPISNTLFEVYSLAAIGDQLYIGAEFPDTGAFTFGIATWNGATLTRATGFFPGPIMSINTFDEGHGSRLFVSVPGTHIDSAIVNGLARWDGSAWSRVGPPGGQGVEPYSGSNSYSASIGALASTAESGQAVVYAGGTFQLIGGTPANRIARWNGSHWSALGAGLGTNSNDYVDAICTFGNDVYAGGSFTGAPSIFRWDGSTWTPVGPSGGTLALAVYDDGSGPALYAGGSYGTNHLARWNGATWTPLLNGPDDLVTSLAVYQDQLCVGGYFTAAGGTPASGVACWDGLSWRPLGIGVSPENHCGCWQFCQPFPQVLALTTYDDGSGPALIAVGMFRTAGAATVNGIGRWNGASWSALSSGIAGGCPTAYSLGVYNDSLFVGGDFDSIGGIRAPGLARWKDNAWHSVGGGLEWSAGSRPSAYTMARGPVAGQQALLVAGGFVKTGNRAASGIGAWVECPNAPCYANCDRSSTPPTLNINDFMCFLNRFAAGDPYANCDGSTTPPILSVADFTCYLNAFAAGCP